MKIKCLAAALLLSLVVSSLATAQPTNERRRLGIIGGLAGAGIGAAAGEDSGDAVPGALIGGAIGLITGSAVGDGIDERNYRQQAYQQAVVQQQAQLQAQAVTMADVVSMTQAGLSDTVIVNHIQTHGVAHRLNASDLIVLKQQGVSDAVLSAMQSIPAPTVVPQPVPAPVIVEEHYHTYPRPAWWYHQRYHRGHWHPRHRGHRHGGFSWGISFSN